MSYDKMMGKEYGDDLATLLTGTMIDYMTNHDVSILPEKFRVEFAVDLDATEKHTVHTHSELDFVTE